MNIAHLIVAHNDPIHIKRLATRLSSFSDVYIHIDLKTNVEDYITSLQEIPNCYFTQKRFCVNWGGMSIVNAELELIKEARAKNHYDRYVLLHGADYPLKNDSDIIRFFEINSHVEFIRGCCISDSKDYYFSDRCKRIWNMDSSVRLTKLILRRIPLRIRSGHIGHGFSKISIFWGSALWALTDSCIDYVLDMSNNNRFNNWFKKSYAPDELYFTTIIMNSAYSTRTLYCGPESRKKGLVNWRNLHYFEYPDQIRVWEKEDLDYLMNRNELYIRKVNTLQSSSLLDVLDLNNLEKAKEICIVCNTEQ